jgi:uncharacterized repeat protein (TIGR01451 family)
MRIRWIVPSSVAFVALLSVILLSQIASQALEPSVDLAVTKSVSPAAIAPGRPVTYEVLLDNSTGSDLHVSSLVDTLPPDFEYVGLAPDSEWDVEPLTTTLPHIQWSGPITVPPSGLTLRYNVYVPGSVPLRAEPYTNTVVAILDSTSYGDEAGLLVGLGEISLVKSAARTRVLPGEVATYTVTFHNHGYAARDLDLVGDVLPQDVTFKRMTGDSDVTDNPGGTTGTIIWSGPLTVPAQDDLVVEYEATMPLVSDTLSLVNEAWGELGGATVGPDSVNVVVGSTTSVYFPTIMRNYAPPRFSVTKTAYPQSAYTDVVEAVFTYTVALYNEGTMPGVLADVRDKLPTGFEFESMVPDQSDVDSAPSGTTGEITWTGPFTVAGESALTLVYRVTSAPIVGTYVNSATATTVEDKGVPPKTPGRATVHIAEPILMEEDWEDPSDYWEPYLKQSRLNEDQWYLSYDEGVDGSTALKHSNYIGQPAGEAAHDALYMYMSPDAEEWTDYRYEARVKLSDGELMGLWFRGKVDEPDDDTQHVEGYYLTMRPQSDYIKLGAIRTNDPPIDHPFEFNNVRELATAPVPFDFKKGYWYTLAVEVEGSHIRCYVNGVPLINYTDSTYPSGTVGMKTYFVRSGLWDDVLVTPLP